MADDWNTRLQRLGRANYKPPIIKVLAIANKGGDNMSEPSKKDTSRIDELERRVENGHLLSQEIKHGGPLLAFNRGVYEVVAVMCTDCVHNPVCKYKSEALKIEKEHIHNLALEGPFGVEVTCNMRLLPQTIPHFANGVR